MAAKKSKRRVASMAASSGVSASPKSSRQHSMKEWICSSLSFMRRAYAPAPRRQRGLSMCAVHDRPGHTSGGGAAILQFF